MEKINSYLEKMDLIKIMNMLCLKWNL